MPSFATSAIDALRAVIPAPVSGDSIESTRALQPAQGNVAPESTQTAQPIQGDKAPTAPADAAPATAADAAPEAAPEPADASAAPKRRGQPPRAAAAVVSAPELVEAPAAPANRRGHLPRDEGASEAAAALPKRTRLASVAAAHDAAQQAPALAEEPTPALVAPPAPPEADHSFKVLLRLWGELHLQGRRAAIHYMANLVAEG